MKKSKTFLIKVSLEKNEIRPEDVFEIKRVRNVKKGERLLVYRRKKYAEEKMLELQKQEEITGQREERSAMVAAEAQKIKDQSQLEREEAKLEKEYSLKIKLEEAKSNNKVREINQEGYWQERLLTKQLEEVDGDGNPIDKPKTFQDPAEAATRINE